MHAISIHRKYCRHYSTGCDECERILKPGFIAACRDQGSVMVQDWAAKEYGETLSRLVACCPYRAVWVRPVG